MQYGIAVSMGHERLVGELVASQWADGSVFTAFRADVRNRLNWRPAAPFANARPKEPIEERRHTTGHNWVVARMERNPARAGWLMRSLVFCRPTPRRPRGWPTEGVVITSAVDVIDALTFEHRFVIAQPGSPRIDDLLLQLDVTSTDALTDFERWRIEREGIRLHMAFRCVVVRPENRNPRSPPAQFDPPPSATTVCPTGPTPKDSLRQARTGATLIVAGPHVPHQDALDVFSDLPAAVLYEDPNQKFVISELFPGNQPVPPLTLLDNVSRLRRNSECRVIVLWNEPDLVSMRPPSRTPRTTQ